MPAYTRVARRWSSGLHGKRLHPTMLHHKIFVLKDMFETTLSENEPMPLMGQLSSQAQRCDAGGCAARVRYAGRSSPAYSATATSHRFQVALMLRCTVYRIYVNPGKKWARCHVIHASSVQKGDKTRHALYHYCHGSHTNEGIAHAALHKHLQRRELHFYWKFL